MFPFAVTVRPDSVYGIRHVWIKKAEACSLDAGALHTALLPSP